MFNSKFELAKSFRWLARIHPSLLILVFAVSLVFWPIVKADFVEWDDGSLIYSNKNYQPVSAASLLRFWKAPYERIYTPLTSTTLGVLAVLGKVPAHATDPPSTLTSKLNPHIFHIFSLLIHLISAVLVWMLLNQIFKHEWAAGAGALLWSLHPLQVETVAWAGETKGLLAGFFALCTLNLYVRFCAHYQNRRASPRLFTAATFCYILALLSKPSAVCLPLVAMAVDYFLIRRNGKLALTSIIPWILLAIPIVWVARGAQPVPSEVSLLPGRPFVAGDALAFYMRKIIYPDSLQMIYARTPKSVMSHWWGYLTWLFPAAVGIIAWKMRRKFPVGIGAFCVFVAALVPNLGFAPFIYQRFSTVADRYAYVALIGPALLLAAWITTRTPSTPAPKMTSKRRVDALTVLCGLWIFTLGVRTALHVPNWRSSIALWTYNIHVNPLNWALINNVGIRELEQNNPSQALIHLREAARLKPDDPEVRTTLALAQFQLGNTEMAIDNFQLALKINPRYGHALLGLGNIARIKGQDEQARSYYQKALQGGLEPEDTSVAYTNLGVILSKQGHQGKAITEFNLALKNSPDNAQAHDGLALAFARRGEMARSESHWIRAIDLDPKLVTARINYATLLTIQNRPGEAISQWKEALRLLDDSEPEKAPAYHNLAILLQSQGHNDEAINNWRVALKLRPHYPEARTALIDALKSSPDKSP